MRKKHVSDAAYIRSKNGSSFGIATIIIYSQLVTCKIYVLVGFSRLSTYANRVTATFTLVVVYYFKLGQYYRTQVRTFLSTKSIRSLDHKKGIKVN